MNLLPITPSSIKTQFSPHMLSRVALALVAFGLGAQAQAQISSINSAFIDSRVFNDVPGATYSDVADYPTSISFSESGVSQPTGFANRDVWYFSNNGGSSAYQMHSGDYFNASFGVTLNGGTSGFGLETGFLFSNPSGAFGGDLQLFVTRAGVVAQTGGPSYYPFSPAAGGYPGAGGSVPNYANGQTYTLGMIYTIDPNTGKDAFEYSVNGQYAASSAGNPYFDLSGTQVVGNSGDFLGGYFQIQNDPSNPTQSGTADFTGISIVPVPEPSALALLVVGFLPFLRRHCTA